MTRRTKTQTRPCKACGHPVPVDKFQCPSCRLMNADEVASDDNFGLIHGDDAEDVHVKFLDIGPWNINFGHSIDEKGKEHVGHPDTTISLVGGKNGAGKSTIVMQAAKHLIRKTKCKRFVVYLSAEEGNGALKSRMRRLGMTKEEMHCVLISPLGKQVNIEAVMKHFKPLMVIGDSISKIAPDPDDAVKFCDEIRLHCEELHIPCILLCHINKEGELAGFEAMQHSVDCVLMMSIDHDKIRTLETLKNRNGIETTTLYQMTADGLIPHHDENGEDNDDEEDD